MVGRSGGYVIGVDNELKSETVSLKEWLLSVV